MYEPLFQFAQEFKSVASALFGGLVGRVFRRDMTTRELVFAIVSICGMALIFAEPIASKFGGVWSVAVVSALIGMFGIEICKSISESIPKIDLAGIIKKRLGGE